MQLIRQPPSAGFLDSPPGDETLVRQHRRRRGHLVAVGEIAVDLVRDDGEVVLGGDRADALDQVFTCERAGRVVGQREDEGAWPMTGGTAFSKRLV